MPEENLLGDFLKKEEKKKTEEEKNEPKIFTIKTTPNREDQVADFLSENAKKKKLNIYAVIRPHGMRGYIFVEALSKDDAEQAAYGIPYARGVIGKSIPYEDIEHMVEIVKKEANIIKGDIAEIISGPFKREKCKITKFDKDKEEVVVELLNAAVPIPITLKIDNIKIIRRDENEE